jgi:hypothetical protein
VSDTTDTVLWCYYDNQAATDQAAPTSVWDSSFIAVHHMTPRPGTLGIRDSTSNAANSTRLSNLDPTDIDGGQSFDGTNDYLSTSGTALPLAGLTGLTVEQVFQYTGAGATGVYHTLASNWNSSPTKASVLIVANPTADSNTLRGFVLRQTNTQVGGTFGVAFAVNTPQYMAIAFDSAANLVGQVNETEGGTTYSAGGAMDATAGDAIRYGDTAHFAGRRLAGAMYEARWSNVARSTAWRSATSRTLRNPLAFLTFGSEETDGISVSLTEAASASAAPAGTAAWAASISAATAAAETISAALGALDVATVAQATATDTAAASAVLQVANIGAAGATDTLAAGASLQVAVIGAAGATTTLSASFDVAGASSVTEVATAADLVTAAAVVAALVSADASADDDLLAAAEVLCLVAEAVSAAATASASLPVTVDVSVAELATALDTIAAALGGLYPTPGFSAGLPGRRWTAVLDSKGTAR